MKEKKEFPVQVGESVTCDFQENTWTFEMPKGFWFTGGNFAIVPTEQWEKMKASPDRSPDNNTPQALEDKGLADETPTLDDYVLEIDWMSTVEFCDKFGLPHPVYTGEVTSSADQFLRLDAIKWKMVVDKAKGKKSPTPPQEKDKQAPVGELKKALRNLRDEAYDLMNHCVDQRFIDPEDETDGYKSFNEAMEKANDVLNQYQENNL